MDELKLEDLTINEKKYYFETKQNRASQDRIHSCKIVNDEIEYFVIFDGHGDIKSNKHTVDFCVNELHRCLESALKKLADRDDIIAFKKTIVDCFVFFDFEMYMSQLEGGSTCSLLLIDTKYKKYYAINLGDSRLIISNLDGTIEFESQDHTPQSERTRIESTNLARVVVRSQTNSYFAIGREGLCVSRAFGDFKFKHTKLKKYDPLNSVLLCLPTIECNDLKENTMFLMTSDGAFDCGFSSQEFIDAFFIETTIETMEKNVKNAINIVSKKTNDDVTIGIVLV